MLELEVYERFREIEFSIFRRVDEWRNTYASRSCCLIFALQTRCFTTWSIYTFQLFRKDRQCLKNLTGYVFYKIGRKIISSPPSKLFCIEDFYAQRLHKIVDVRQSLLHLMDEYSDSLPARTKNYAATWRFEARRFCRKENDRRDRSKSRLKIISRALCRVLPGVSTSVSRRLE